MLDRAPHLTAESVAPAPGIRTNPAGTTRTIIANSAIQFLDLSIDQSNAAAILDRYFEEQATGDEAPSLYHIELDDSGAYYHPTTNEPVDAGLLYAVDGRKALDALAGVWLPLPFMRVVEDPRTGGEQLEEGPSNWVRLYIAPRQSMSESYRLVLAIDTAFEAGHSTRGGPNIAPTPEDAAASRRFRSSAVIEEIGWFVTESWVDEWLVEAYREQRTRVVGDDGRDETPIHRPLEHLAHYLTLLNVLSKSDILPELQLLAVTRRVASHRPVAVDLVLDIGASRSCALVSEAASSKGAHVPIRVLPLRDLARPAEISRGNFSSRTEFARTNFGKDVYSRWSGRTSAFYWPSLVRVGDEAARLASEQTSADAFTGLSSPIRYLWDAEPARHVWRFSGSTAPQRRNGLIAGHLLTHLTEAGDVQDPKAPRQPTTKPRFSRSSMTTFFVAEVMLQAVSWINSPDYREPLDDPTAPRRLARIILTPPAAMQPVERVILQRRVEAAVKLVWQAFGWTGEGQADALAPPEVSLGPDGAIASQLAYVENEIGGKFNGNARQYLSLLGRSRSGHGSPRSIRIATLDVGGGSAGVAVATHALADAGGFAVRHDLVEGFPIGGDDILKSIVEAMVLPAVEQKFADSKLAEPRKFITALAHGETHGRASRIAELRRRFASEIAMPAAIALLREHETLRSTDDDRQVSRSLRALIAVSGGDASAAAAELESLASDEGSDSFELLDAEVPFTLSQIAGIVRDRMRPVVANAARVIRNLDCDVLLLSGWMTRLPIVREMFLEAMPIRPDRIISMHEYRMGAWFPGRLVSGSIHDPKPLPAVGALIASRRDPMIGGQKLDLKALDSKRAPVQIGRLGADGLVAADAVLFEQDQSSSEGRDTVQQVTLTVEPPLSIGLRRTTDAAWPALPIYALVLADMAPEARPRMPLRVTLEWRSHGADLDMPWIVRATDADGGELASSEISLRLQTLATSLGGHWLDTGVFAVS